MNRVGIGHLSFALGDRQIWYRDLPDIEERIRRLEIFTAATKASGHCYGADPFINMQTCCEGGGAPGESYVVCASGRTSAGASLVRRLR